MLKNYDLGGSAGTLVRAALLQVTPPNCDEWGTEVPKERFIEESEEKDWAMT